MVGRPWTTKGKNLLRENWVDSPKEKIMKLLPDKSWGAIFQMARRMGLPPRNDQGRFIGRTFWTKEEEKLLRENYKDLPKDKLMELLHRRSWETIIKKGRSMNLPFRYNHPLKKARPFKPLTDFEKGYLCGVIDGEGSLNISYSRGNGRYRSRYIPHLTICNTDITLLKRCNQIMSGYGRLSDFTLKNGKCSTLTIGRLNEIKIVLEAIVDGLVAKREQAKLLLEFIKKYEGKLRVWGEDFAEIHEKMKELNTGRRRISIKSINTPNS